MKYKVRAIEATGGYVDSIRWMDRVCFPGQSSLVFDGAFWWMAFDEDNVPCAYASTTYYPNLNTAFLSRAGVLPGARGNKLQRRLVRARERAAKQHGYHRVVTYTSVYNPRSSNNLIECGYRLYVPAHEWGLKGANYWQKNLSTPGMRG